MIYIFIFIFGAIIGSFLNVCIHRLPKDMSIISPPSACPVCNTPIKVWQNIPIISYIFLKGRCAFCGEKISIKYPLVEFTNAVLYLLVYYQYGFGWHLLTSFGFVSAMIVITFIDLDFQIIPDVITISFTVLGLALSSFIVHDPFKRYMLIGFINSLIGAVIGFGAFYLIAVLSKGGMGGGDIKMMAAVGAFTGYKGVLLTTFLGSITGAIVGIYLMLYKGAARKTKIPFGPFLALGALITLTFGQEILRWYLGGRYL